MGWTVSIYSWSSMPTLTGDDIVELSIEDSLDFQPVSDENAETFCSSDEGYEL